MKSNVLEPPTWLTAEDAQSQMSSAAWKFISYSGSLTEHLRHITNNKINFRLLFANWEHANPMERQALNLSGQMRTWIRCIEHRYENNLWVYGRAIFPETTINATKGKISGLGVQSLGEIIFKDTHLKRDPFLYCLLSKESAYYLALSFISDVKDSVWARRSVVYFQAQPILITEIFMPESYAQSNA